MGRRRWFWRKAIVEGWRTLADLVDHFSRLATWVGLVVGLPTGVALVALGSWLAILLAVVGPVFLIVAEGAFQVWKQTEAGRVAIRVAQAELGDAEQRLTDVQNILGAVYIKGDNHVRGRSQAEWQADARAFIRQAFGMHEEALYVTCPPVDAGARQTELARLEHLRKLIERASSLPIRRDLDVARWAHLKFEATEESP